MTPVTLGPLSMPLVGADIPRGTGGAGEAVEVEQWHAGGDAEGAAGGAGVDRHGAALEMVVPGDVAGVVHEQRTELGAGEGDRARLHSGRAGDVPGRVVVDDVVVVDDMASEGVALVNTVLATVHDDVVVHGGVVVDRDGGIGRDLNAVPTAVRDHVVADDQVRGAVVRLNAGGCRTSDDVVLDHPIGAGDVDPVHLIDLAPGADVVDHVA